MNTDKISYAYKVAQAKAMNNIDKIGIDLREFPGVSDGKYFETDRNKLKKIEHIFCWTQSFFTGMALLNYGNDKDKQIIEWCDNFYSEYYKKVFENPQDTMHDLGFLYTLYSTMYYKITNAQNMKQLSIKAAEVLAHRFVSNGKYIRAWGRMDDTIPENIEKELITNNFFANSKGLAIIDCMMNLPLLFWASEETGDVFYRNIAVAHADTTLKYFVRDDGSVCHAFKFDTETGEPLCEFNDCGYSVGSHWARGAAWAVMGFALAYKYTKLQRYYDAAIKIAKAYLEACGENIIPQWDFRLPKETPARYGGVEREWNNWDITKAENCIYNVDSSAACIMCCGFFELLKVKDEPILKNYIESSIDKLCSEFLDNDMQINGLLKRTNGVDGYAIFADYYFMELLARLLDNPNIPW